MRAIRRRRNVYAVLSVEGIILAAAFVISKEMSAAIVCGVFAAAAIVMLCFQSRLLFWCRLICDTKILTVASSVVSSEKAESQKTVEETIVAAFGLLLGDKVYRWGCEGISGVRLREVSIDKSHMCLTFGAAEDRMSVKMLHGITDKHEMTEITKKLKYETGVQATVSDWEKLIIGG